MRRILLATILVSCAAQQQWVVPQSAPAGAAPLSSASPGSAAATTAATSPTGAASTASSAKQARVIAARKGYELVAMQWFTQGNGTREEVYVWSRRLFESEREAGVPTAAADHLARMQKLRDQTQKSFQAGGAGSRDVAAAEYFVAEAAAWP